MVCLCCFVRPSSSWDLSSDDESVLSEVSDVGSTEWSTAAQGRPLQFEVDVRFNVPDIIIDPALSAIQSGLDRVATGIVDVTRNIMWWAADVNESFHKTLARDPKVVKQVEQLSSAVTCEYFMRTKDPCAHAISDAISRTKRVLPYPARLFFSRSIVWVGKKVITYYLKTPFFPISPNLAVFCRSVTRLKTRAG